jgi:cytochrome b6-f complex iron-sulfur subunit
MSASREPDRNTAGDPGVGREETTRRGAVAWLWSVLGLAAVAELSWITASFVRPRTDADADPSEVVVAGRVGDFAPGSVTPFPAGRFYLVRLDDGGFLAVHRECTHLGCTVPWRAESGRFECPCHASVFDITGEVLGPPAARPLDLLPVRLENGIVKVDVARRMRRSSFNPSQVVRS